MDKATRGASAQQIIMLEHNNHGHAKHSKGVPKKLMVQRTLKPQTNLGQHQNKIISSAYNSRE